MSLRGVAKKEKKEAQTGVRAKPASAGERNENR